jgi:hypothetical protein
MSRALTWWRQVAGPADRPDPVVARAESDQVAAVTQPWRCSRLVTGGQRRAWCFGCWPSRCGGTAEDTSVWRLDAPYTGTWAELDAAVGTRFPDDCSGCGGWGGPVVIAMWSDDSQASGEVWAFCRRCAVQVTAAGAWRPTETIAELHGPTRDRQQWPAIIAAAHTRRVPAQTLTAQEVAAGAWMTAGTPEIEGGAPC